MSPASGLLLGLIQGLSSAFPVSSSGHLRLFTEILHAENAGGLPFYALLHLGTFLAILFVFRREVIRLFTAYLGMIVDALTNLIVLVGGRDRRGGFAFRKILGSATRRFALLYLISLFPTILIGRLLSGSAEKSAGPLLITAAGFFVSALLLLVSSFFGISKKGPARAKVSDALVVGVFQGVSVFPGISRLGCVLSASNLCGLSRRFAISLSYLLALPLILGSLITELPGKGEILKNEIGFGVIIPAVLVSAAVGILVIGLAVRILRKNKDRVFAVYCAAIGIVCVLVKLLGR